MHEHVASDTECMRVSECVCLSASFDASISRIHMTEYISLVTVAEKDEDGFIMYTFQETIQVNLLWSAEKYFAVITQSYMCLHPVARCLSYSRWISDKYFTREIILTLQGTQWTRGMLPLVYPTVPSPLSPINCLDPQVKNFGCGSLLHSFFLFFLFFLSSSSSASILLYFAHSQSIVMTSCHTVSGWMTILTNTCWR